MQLPAQIFWTIWICAHVYVWVFLRAMTYSMGILCIVSTSVKMSSVMFPILWSHTYWSKHVFLGLPSLSQSEVIADDTFAASLHSQLANQQSAILRNWRRLRMVRWHIMAVKRVSIMVCLVKHSQPHFLHLSPQAMDRPLSFISFSHEWEICLLKIPLRAVQYIHQCITLND